MSHYFTDTAETVLNTSTGNQTISFSTAHGTPRLVVFLCSRATLDADATGAPEDHGSISWGAVDGTSEWVVSFSDEHNVNPANAFARGRLTRCIQILDPTTGAVDGACSFVSFGTGQVTINVDNAPASAYKVTAWGLFGDGLEIEVGSATGNATQDASTTVTLATGFTGRPTGFLFAHLGQDGFGSLMNPAHFGMGFASDHLGDINQSGIGYSWLSNGSLKATRVSSRYGVTLARYASAPISEAVQPQLELTATSAGDFTMTTRGNSGAVEFAYVAISGCDCFGGILDFPTGTGVKTFGFPTGTSPIGARGFLMCPNRINATDVDTNVTGALSGVGGASVAAGEADSGSTVAFARQNNTTPTNTQTIYDNIVLNMPDHTGASGHEGTWDGVTATDDEYEIDVTVGVSNEKAFPQLVVGYYGLVPTVLSVSVAFPSPTLAALLSPDTLAAAIALGEPTLAAILQPTALSLTISLGLPTLTAILKPDVLAVAVALGQPTLVAVLQPDALALSVALGAPTLVAVLVPDTVAVGVSIGSPTLVAVLLPDALAVSVSVGEPSLLAILSPDALALAIVFGAPAIHRWLPSATPAGQVVQSGAVAAIVSQSGMTAANVVQSGPVAGQVVESGAVQGEVAQSGAVAGNVVQSGAVEGQVVQDG